MKPKSNFKFKEKVFEDGAGRRVTVGSNFQLKERVFEDRHGHRVIVKSDFDFTATVFEDGKGHQIIVYADPDKRPIARALDSNGNEVPITTLPFATQSPNAKNGMSIAVSKEDSADSARMFNADDASADVVTCEIIDETGRRKRVTDPPDQC